MIHTRAEQVALVDISMLVNHLDQLGRGKRPRLKNYGICDELRERFEEMFRVLRHAPHGKCSYWDLGCSNFYHFSGNLNYPIEGDSLTFALNNRKWDNKHTYGWHRANLCKHLARTFRANRNDIIALAITHSYYEEKNS